MSSSNPPNCSCSWSDLPPDLLTLIAQKIDAPDDFFRFGGVCRSWRSLTLDTTQFPVFRKPPFPWLMLTPDGNDKNDDTRSFVSPLERRVRRLMLPELGGCRCWGSDCGWLVCFDPANGYLVTLLNPLTREIMCFPSLSRYHAVHIRKAVLSVTYLANNASRLDFKIFVITGRPLDREVVFATYGDVNWNAIKLGTPIQDVLYSNDELFMVNCDGHIWVYNGIYLKVHPTDFWQGHLNEELNNMVYLLKLRGCLLMVVKNQRYNTREDLYETISFQVFMLHDLAEWYPVEILGSYALFVGDNASFALNAVDYPGCKPGCIYFTDDREENFGSSRPDMGVFNLADHKFEEPFYKDNDALSRFSPPIWIKPNIYKSLLG